MPHNDQKRLLQMIEYAEKSQKISNGRTRENFENDDVLRYALIYIVQTIGEAASRISQVTRDRHQQIPWRTIIGTRNFLVHAFDKIDHDIVWQVVIHRIPGLILQLKQVKLNAE